MATDAQKRTRLRRDVGADATTLDDTEADALLAEAAEIYTNDAAVQAYARVLAIQGILANAAKLASYRANNSSENLSDVYKHLSDLLDRWEKKVAQADGNLDAYFEVY